jgi:ABC-type transport system involved in multi-copper enzyme maturation permease subunit
MEVYTWILFIIIVRVIPIFGTVRIAGEYPANWNLQKQTVYVEAPPE